MAFWLAKMTEGSSPFVMRKYRLARSLRKTLSPPEVRLWVRLRARGDGTVIRRQHPFGPYILDFYCPDAQLAIEVDGAQHNEDEASAHDTRRDDWLAEQGIETLRIPAIHIMQDADAAADYVLEEIRLRLAEPGK